MSGEPRNSYPFETKLAAVRAHVDDGLTSTEAMERFEIKSKSAFFRWCASYRSSGVESLRPRKRGRPRKQR